MSDAYVRRMGTDAGRRGLAEAELRYRAVELIERSLAEDGLTQKELADRLGLSESAVSQVLGGDRNLTLNKVADYAHALRRRVHMDFLHGLEGAPVTTMRQTIGGPSYRPTHSTAVLRRSPS